MTIAVRVRVTGRVQGVGFRAYTRERARAEALSGWVRNQDDGSVEALLQGPGSSVNEVIDWMRAGGPPGGHVTGLDVHPISPDPVLTSFTIRA